MIVPASARARAIRDRLLRWYRSRRRALPWRGSADPYRVWVAEVMLQQTQVATVVPFYERFLARFPDLRALAAADEEEVVGAWSGLGYYSRARNLHGSARRVVAEHGGRLPAERAALEALPGIGRYTAGAILSIAYGKEEVVVDGNVRRLLSRLFARPSAGRAAPGRNTAPPAAPDARPPALPPPAVLEAQAGALLRGAPPADLNQALMELGALVCRPVSPRCGDCPLARLCSARRLGIEEQVPAPRRRPAAEKVRRAVALIRAGGCVLLARDGGPGAPRGMWDLPGGLVPAGRTPRRHLARHLRGRGLRARLGRAAGEVEHAITYRRIHTTAYEASLSEPCAPGPHRRWAGLAELPRLPLSAAARRILGL